MKQIDCNESLLASENKPHDDDNNNDNNNDNGNNYLKFVSVALYEPRENLFNNK